MVQRNVPNVQFSLDYLDPPLPFLAQFFNALYGIPIFTHLSEAKHVEWLDELVRVCRPGAVLFLTTHGEVVVRANVKEGHRVYVAFQPTSYMLRLFENKCQVLSHRVGNLFMNKA